MSEIFRCSGGIRGIKANEVGWGTRGILEQVNVRGGDCRAGDGGLVQALMSLRTTSDLVGDIEREGTEGAESSGVELVWEFPSYMHSLPELWHEVHGRPASHLCSRNPRLVSSVRWDPFRRSNLLFHPIGNGGNEKLRQHGGSLPHGYDREGKVTNLQGRHASPVANTFPGLFFRV